RLTLRAAQGFIDSIFSLMNVPLRCPDYSCVSRRAKSVNVSFKSKRAARTVLTGMCYSVGSATRQGSSSLTRFIGQSAMTLRT
ncbi:transposase, partial [Enterobacter roggenkampii]|uniref:transposase n=1 Tax=Enterobacter roggenkampii TaxID=1812935 RepID=UPI003D686012